MRQHTGTTSAWRGCLPLLLFFGCLRAPTAAPAPLHVVWSAGHLSISAAQVPLAQLLQEVARQTGMPIHGLEELEEPISVHFVGLPLHQGFQKLLVDFAILWEPFPPGDLQPVRALIFGRQQGPSTATNASPAGRSREAGRATRLMDPPTAAPEDSVAFTAPVDVTVGTETEERLTALQHVVEQAEDQAALFALQQALKDGDLTAKSYAIHALATWEGPATLEYLRQALHDPDPTVQRLVVEQLAQYDRGHLLLEEALTVVDEEARFLAAAALAQAAWREP